MKSLFRSSAGLIAACLISTAAAVGSLAPRDILAHPNTQRIACALIICTAVAIGFVPPDAMIGMALLNTTPFVQNPLYTSIALAYRNEALIADRVLPRTPVPTTTFKFLKYNKGDRFTVPDTLVGRKSQPNQVEFGATEESASTQDHGLDDYVPQTDVDAAANVPGYDPLAMAAEGLTDVIALAREKRVADLVFNTDTYDANHKETLVGSGQWSHASSDPQRAVADAMDACIMRPNIMVVGREVATQLRLNPALIQAYNKNDGNKGMIPLSAMADLFEVQEFIVGEGWLNIAKKGQAPNLVRVWGKSAALLHINKRATHMNGTTFGYTAQFGTKIGAGWFNRDVGLKGSHVVRIGEQVKELAIAQDLGFLFDAAVA